MASSSKLAPKIKKHHTNRRRYDVTHDRDQTKWARRMVHNPNSENILENKVLKVILFPLLFLQHLEWAQLFWSGRKRKLATQCVYTSSPVIQKSPRDKMLFNKIFLAQPCRSQTKYCLACSLSRFPQCVRHTYTWLTHAHTSTWAWSRSHFWLVEVRASNQFGVVTLF